MRRLTWVIPYYRNKPMLEEVHMKNLAEYDDEVLQHLTVLYVDDGSPEEDRPDEVLAAQPARVRKSLRLLRVLEDIPWNQHGARNLGAKQAKTRWLMVTDMDRILLAHDMRILLTRKLQAQYHYKPLSTKMHKTLPRSDTGPRAPYNQFICTKGKFWEAGGYDEDYCGTYGGDAPFLRALEKVAPLQRLTNVRMFRYNRWMGLLSNTETLVRNREEYSARIKAKRANDDLVPKNHIRFKWVEVDLA